MKTKKIQPGQYEITLGAARFLVDNEEGAEGWNIYEITIFADGREGVTRIGSTETLREAKEFLAN